MVIKCGNNEYTITAKDEILFNGKQYKIITQGSICGPHVMVPIIWKSVAQRLIKKGILVKDKTDGNNVYYRVDEEN